MTTLKRLGRATMALTAGALMLLTAASVRADILELINGDHYSGTVVVLTRTNLEFVSEVQGLVKIPRDKIATITLHEAVPKAVPLPPKAPGATNSSSSSASTPAAQSALVMQQMRTQGVDPNMMNQIQQQMLGQSNPEATKMFNEMMGGLMSGSISVDDIRGQARKAISDIQSARKDLGDDAGTLELLDGYLGILQKFVQETDAPAPKANAPAVAASPGK